MGLFYQLQLVNSADDLSGPVLFVGNHPNSMIDPALVFANTDRQVTFLAREPLFRVPLLGWLMRGIGALPVYRKQDHPGQMQRNEGTLEAAAGALIAGKAITIFPEGKSHSEPQLSEIKTGAARIVFRAVKAGVTVRIVPIGLTYQQKHRFHSRVLLQVGVPVVVAPPGALSADAEVEWVRALTEQVASAMKDVTLNLQEWADLGLIQTAEQLYALRIGQTEHDPDRVRRFARGVGILRKEQPDLFERLRDEVMSFRGRLQMVFADPADLSLQYRRPEVARFVARNLASVLVGFPLFALGLVLFVIPFMVVRLTSRVVPLAADRIATLKFTMAVVVTPLRQGVLSWAAWRWWGTGGLMVSLVGGLPLAFFTRYFVERWRSVLRDIATFFTLGNRLRLKARLLVEGERLAADIEALAVKLKPRTMTSRPEEEPDSA